MAYYTLLDCYQEGLPSKLSQLVLLASCLCFYLDEVKEIQNFKKATMKIVALKAQKFFARLLEKRNFRGSWSLHSSLFTVMLKPISEFFLSF